MSLELEIGPHLAKELDGCGMAAMLLMLALAVRIFFTGFGRSRGEQ